MLFYYLFPFLMFLRRLFSHKILFHLYVRCGKGVQIQIVGGEGKEN